MVRFADARRLRESMTLTAIRDEFTLDELAAEA